MRRGAAAATFGSELPFFRGKANAKSPALTEADNY